MPKLDGSGKSVGIAPGYTLVAPGLVGTVTTYRGRGAQARGRGPEKATDALDGALQAAGVSEIMTIEMEVRPTRQVEALPRLVNPQNEDALQLETPDQGVAMGQVVLAIDEYGIVTWNLPLNRLGRLQKPSMGTAGGSRRFLIRRHVPAPMTARDASARGLVQVLGRKILKVLVYSVTDPLIGTISRSYVHKWEQQKRPYAVRWFGPDDYLQPDLPPITDDGWRELSHGKALLFIHGTNSTASAGFAGFPRSFLAELHGKYEGRVFAFNHFTLSENPEQNVDWFIQHIPPDIRLNVDIISHSRGGLVARTLAGALKGAAFPQCSVDAVVFAGVPNNGTILSNAAHITDFIDRYTTILNLAPPGPLNVVAGVLEGIITVVKVLGHGVLNGLPGLAAMDPRGDFIKRLNSPGARPSGRFYALTSDFEPEGGLKDLVKQKLQDVVADRAFGNEANDLLVPTDGVFQGDAAGFPIPKSHVLRFAPSRGVWHSSYFSQPDTAIKLREWL